MVCNMKLHQETSWCEVQTKMNPIRWCSPLLPPPPQWHIQEPQAPRRSPPIHMIVAIKIDNGAIKLDDIKKSHACPICTDQGHNRWDCPNRICSKCNDKGHDSWDFPHRVCYKRNNKGHSTLECLNPICTKCSCNGHESRKCPNLLCGTCNSKYNITSEYIWTQGQVNSKVD
jgi:hypothetical protein